MTLTTIQTHRKSIGDRREARDRHDGIWRGLIVLPSMTGSVLLLVLLLGWMGPWEDVGLAAWSACAALLMTRVGERAAVMVALDFRRPTPAQTEVLDVVWTAALRRAELSHGQFDLYVHCSSELNAYAAGRRSVAVTFGLLQQFVARRLTEDQMQALLLHELGHHATGATTGGLSAKWLALPWRASSRLLVSLAVALSRRSLSRRSVLGVVATGVVVALVQAVQQHNWLVTVVLGALSLCTLACPIADAALVRRGEYAADRYAHDLGYGPQLTSTLEILDAGQGHLVSLTARMLNRHPSTSRRIHALDGASRPA